MEEKKLNARQEAFVQAFVRCRNATRAAVAAGYSRQSARFQGAKLLSDRRVRQKINEMLQNVAEQAEAGISEIIKSLYLLSNDRNVSGAARVKALSEIVKILEARAIRNFDDFSEAGEQQD
jgi:phage terminase small subunit